MPDIDDQIQCMLWHPRAPMMAIWTSIFNTVKLFKLFKKFTWRIGLFHILSLWHDKLKMKVWSLGTLFFGWRGLRHLGVISRNLVMINISDLQNIVYKSILHPPISKHSNMHVAHSRVTCVQFRMQWWCVPRG